MIKYIILLYILNNFYQCNCASVSTTETIFTTILFRHGDRTPVFSYPTDPNANYPLWSELGEGQLTKRGKAQHYALGQWFRKRYGHLLSSNYRYSDIYVQSTDVDRTLMSAESNLAGLFPPKINEVWSENVPDWQPIPVHTIPEKDDFVLAGYKKCPKYDYEMINLMESPIFKKIDEMNAPLYAYVTEHSGRNISDLLDLSSLYDTLLINTLYNLTIPNWTHSIFPNPLKQWSSISFERQCFTKSLQRLKIGAWFNEIIERMFLKVRNGLNPNRGIWMYSAHDVTIANVLMALSIYNFQPPPYASALMFDLQKRNNSYGISIYFKNETNNDTPYLLKLPKCDEFCDLNDFQKILTPILITPNQWDIECQRTFLSDFTYNNLDTTSVLVITSGILVIILLIASLGIALAYMNKRTTNKFYFRLEGYEH